MAGPAWGELPPDEPGRIFWWQESQPTQLESIQGRGGNWQQYAQYKADEPKESKRGGIFGIFVRLRVRKGDPGHDIVKNVMQRAMRHQLEHERWELTQPDNGPQVIPQGGQYYITPQVFDAPPSGWRDEQGRWHDGQMWPR